VKDTALIFKDDVSMMEAFRTADVVYVNTGDGHYLRRGDVVLKIDKEANFPPTMLETIFWLRWAGFFNSQTFRESVVVVGPTGCKTEALHFLLSSKCQEQTLSRETQISELVGSCVLRSPESSKHDVDVLVNEVKGVLEDCIDCIKKEKIEDLIESVELMLKSDDHKNQTQILRGALFMFLGVQKMQMKHQFTKNSDDEMPKIRVLTSFIPGGVTRAAVLAS
jgi:hypothetical protein